MRIRTRILIGFFIIFAIAFYFITDFVKNEIRPRYLEAIEESLNDTANILSSLLEHDIKKNRIKLGSLRGIFTRVYKKKISAKIYSLHKKDINLRAYVTNQRGIVIYDSDDGKNEGKDFSKWNDVYLTLRGKYGARSTDEVPSQPSSNSLFVSAPVKHNKKIIGVVTVIKPEDSVHLFIELAKRKIIIAGILACMVFVFLSVMLSLWINRPVMKLIKYVKSLKKDMSIRQPKFMAGEIKDIASAFDEMRFELEGKKYIENYLLTLTHELKSPLSSIRGSAELLSEEMPNEQKKKFYGNILNESIRIENVINRLLELSSLEARKELKDIEKINLSEIVNEINKTMSPRLLQKNIEFENRVGEKDVILGERFLVIHALMNLIKNAIEFTDTKGKVIVNSEKANGFINIVIYDNGQGIPDFAMDKIFDKFYSISGKEGTKKGTGLGLAFVRETALLHGGSIDIKNNSNGGVTAVLSLPL
ncbi:two-component system sensor histidine kinase CreC [Spirochaetota bacterium]